MDNRESGRESGSNDLGVNEVDAVLRAFNDVEGVCHASRLGCELVVAIVLNETMGHRSKGPSINCLGSGLLNVDQRIRDRSYEILHILDNNNNEKEVSGNVGQKDHKEIENVNGVGKESGYSEGWKGGENVCALWVSRMNPFLLNAYMRRKQRNVNEEK